MSVSNYFSFLQKILETNPFTVTDLLFFVFLILFIVSERQRQFVRTVLTFLFTGLTVLLALGMYGQLSLFMQQYLLLSKGAADGMSFLLVISLFAGIAIVGYRLILININPNLLQFKLSVPAIIMGFGTFIIVSSCLMMILLSFPITPFMKNIINNSTILSSMTVGLQTVESIQYRIFSRPSTSLLNFLVNTPRQASQITIATNGSWTQVEHEEIKLYERINKKRIQDGLPSLMYSDELSVVAGTLARETSTSQILSQSSVKGATPFDVLVSARVQYTTAYFIPIYAQSRQLAFNGIQHVSEYNKQLMSRQYSRIGIGSAWLKEYGFIFTILLAD